MKPSLLKKFAAIIAVVVGLTSAQQLFGQEADEKGPPLPFHTIEGYGGGAITPMAYLVNPNENCFFGKPSAALSFVSAREKDLTALTITETLFGRIELGYGADRLGLGTLPSDIDQEFALPGVVQENELWLHNFNIRGLLVKENTCFAGFALPAITVGMTVKYNTAIANINSELNNALTGIGYRKASGEDFFVTATKTFPTLGLGRPVVVSGGVRLSEAASLGFLGFGDKYRASLEGNIAWLPFDRLLLAYEFRQVRDPYGTITGGPTGYLVGPEDNWQAFDVALILNKHSTLVVGWGIFGTLANTRADNSWFVQFKHEF